MTTYIGKKVNEPPGKTSGLFFREHCTKMKFFFFNIFIGVSLLYNGVLVSAV